MHADIHAKCLSLLSDFNQHFNMSTNFSKTGQYKIIWKPAQLVDRAIEVRSPTGAEDFSSSPCVQTGSEAHPAFYPVGTGGPFPGG
jgi:hypothetical protein